MLRRCFFPARFFFRSLRRLLCMLQATHAHTRRLVLISLLLRRTTSTSTTMATSPANGGTVAAPAAAAATPAPAAAAPTETTPLGAVVKDAVRRWYEDALREAERGDVVSKARRRERERERGDGCALPQAAALNLIHSNFHSLFLSLLVTHTQKQQALLSQMLIEGYGCTPDPAAAERWAARARRRGYRMEGVYCTI